MHSPPKAARIAAALAALAALLALAALGWLRRAGRAPRELEPHLAARPGPSGDEILLAVMSVRPGAAAAESIAVRSGHGDAPPASSPAVSDPEGRLIADPTVAFAADGGFLLAFLAFRPPSPSGSDPHDMALLLARGRPGEPRFGPPRQIASGGPFAVYDRPRLLVTESGQIVVVARAEDRQSAAIAAFRSPDGERFVREDLAGGAGFGGALPSACSSGDTIHAVWFDPVLGIQLGSSDGEDSGLAPRRVTRVSVEDEPVALEAPSCAASGDELWVAYGLAAAPLDTGASAAIGEMVLAHSPDRGRRFDRRLRHRDPRGLIAHPALSLSHGELALAYYAGPPTPGAAAFQSARVSPDGATSIATVHAPLSLALSRRDPSWIGDYVGLAFAGAHLYAALVDAEGHAPRALVARLR